MDQVKDRSVAYVYETYDYSRFKMLESNRIVTDARVSKLLASFGEKVIDTPIICNEHWEIVDGQGRYEARKKLELPIPYIVIEGLDNYDCIRLNQYNTNWTLPDFVDSFARNKDPEISRNYLELQKCAVDNSIAISRVLHLWKHKPRMETVLSGNLKFTPEDSADVTETIHLGNEILGALCFGQRTNEAFWSSVKVAKNFPNYNHSKFIRNCISCRTTYHQMSNLEAELKEFSRIYNFKTSEKSNSRIYFEDYMRNRGYNVRTYEEQHGIKPSDRNVSTLTKRRA